MADIAEDILTNKSVFISNEVLAEVVYVLLGVYSVSKAQIADQLSQLIDFDNVTTLDDDADSALGVWVGVLVGRLEFGFLL